MLINSVQKFSFPIKALLTFEKLFQQSIRTTFILKRRNSVPLHKQGEGVQRFRNRHYIYDLVKDCNLDKDTEIDVILTRYVEGLGDTGERVSLKPNKAYNSLILPGLAVYASPENVEKFKDYDKKEKKSYSSPYAKLTAEILGRKSLSVVMNRDTPWTLKKCHIRASFRKCGYHVPDEAITMPEKTISGPDMNLENKEFYITVTINNCEKENVRCLIHHWSTDLAERIPHTHEFWKFSIEPIFPEDVQVLQRLEERRKSYNPKKKNLN